MPCFPNPQHPQDKHFPQNLFKFTTRLCQTAPNAKGEETTVLMLLVPLSLPYPHFDSSKIMCVSSLLWVGSRRSARAHYLILIFIKTKKTVSSSPWKLSPLLPEGEFPSPPLGQIYATAAFSTVSPQSSAPALAEEQVAPEWGSRDKHGNDAGKATPSGQSRRTPVRGTQRSPARGKTTPKAASENAHSSLSGTWSGQTLRTRW